jgi:4,5-dihydroxyphthalate decarboxylase
MRSTGNNKTMKHLSAMMGTYPKTTPMKDGRVDSSLLQLNFADIEVAQKGFKDVVRQEKFDVAELAIMTFLVAHEAGKPYLLLPFVMNGNFHHKSILCRTDAKLAPGELAGKKVAMRSYSQTTPTWVRGILADEYGLHLNSVQWLSQEGSHVAEYRDPDCVTPLDSSAGLEPLLLNGDVDAIIAGGALSEDPGISRMIPDAGIAALAWYAKTRVVPINHVVVIRKEIAKEQPEIVREVFRMLCESRKVGGDLPHAGGPDLQPVGFKALQPALEMAVRYAYEQKLITKRYALEELYGDVIKALA